MGLRARLEPALTGEGEANAQVRAQLARLERAAKSPSTEELKREAMSVAQSIGVIFEERKRRQVSQVTELGERMAALGLGRHRPGRAGGDVGRLGAASDPALYEAKNGGRDRVASARSPEPPPEVAA